MRMKIYHNDYEIHESGTLASADLSDTRFVLSEEPLMEIVCRISKEGGENMINLEVLNENSLAIVFTNPKIPSFGPTTPIKVGHLDGKGLYVSFRVTMRGNDDSYGLVYTFYTREDN